MNRNDGEAISFAKYNMPLTVGRTEEEVFLSSIAMAIPTDRDFLSMNEVPESSSGTITLEGTTIHRFRSVLPMGRMEPQFVHDGYEIVLDLLKEKGPCFVGVLNNGVRGMWGEQVDLRYPLTYSILTKLIPILYFISCNYVFFVKIFTLYPIRHSMHHFIKRFPMKIYS
jgi:hypothetical protein